MRTAILIVAFILLLDLAGVIRFNCAGAFNVGRAHYSARIGRSR